MTTITTATLTDALVLKAVSGSRPVGSVRTTLAAGTCTVGRLIVDPELQGQGIGSMLLQSVEAECVSSSKFELFTGTKSEANVSIRVPREALLCSPLKESCMKQEIVASGHLMTTPAEMYDFWKGDSW